MDIKEVPTLEERLKEAENTVKEAKKQWKDYCDYTIAEAQKAIDRANGNRNKGSVKQEK